MATIYELIIAASVDPRGIKTGAEQGGRYFREFATAVTSELDQLGKGASTSGVAVADAILGSATNTFRQKQAELREAFFSGAMSEATFRTRGQELARAFNASLTGGLSLLRTELNKSTTNGLATLETLTGAYKAEGLRAGRAYSSGVQEGMGSGGAGGMGWPGRGPGFQVMGRNAAPAVTAVAFGFESLARSATAAEGGVRAASRSLGVFAAGFGPEGVLVTALIAGGVAIFEFFDRARLEAEKTTREFQKHLGEMANTGRTDDLQANARRIQFGQPFDAKGTAVAPSALVQGAFAGSVSDLRAQLKSLQDQFYSEVNGFRQQAIQQRIIDVKAQLKPLEEQLRAVTAAAMNVANQPADNAGKRPDIVIDVKTDAALARESAAAWRAHVESLRAAIDSYKVLESEHILTRQSGLSLLSTYQSISSELAAMSDLTTKHAADLLKLRKEIELTNMVQSITGPLPGISQAKAGPAALAGKSEDAVKTAGELLDRARLLAEAGMSSTAAYRQTIDALRIVDSFLASANQREGITNDRLREQLAIRAQLNAVNALRGLVIPTMQDPSIRGQVDAYMMMQRTAVGAKAAGASNAGELERAANEQRERAVRLIRNVVEESGRWNNITLDEQRGLADLVDLLRQMGEETDRSVNGWAAIAVGMRGVIDAASALGKIPQELQAGVSAAEHLVSSVQKISQAKAAADKAGGGGWNVANLLGAVGGAVGAAGAAIGVVSSIAGLFSQHDAALDRNTQKLDQLRGALIDTKGISGEQTALAAIQQWAKGFSNPFGMSSGNGNQGLDALLVQMGMSVDQFNKIASDLGIEFSRGTAWLEQFEHGLQLAIEAQRRFSDSLGDQQSLAQLKLKLYGKDSPQDAIASTIAILNQFAPKLGAGLAGIDASTEEGRAKIQKGLQQLYEQLAAGALTAEEFGKLGGAKDLASIIGDLMGNLNALSKSASSAAASLLYVPAGYKVALARFNATTAIPAPFPGSGGPLDTRPSIPSGDGTLIGQVQMRPPSSPNFQITGPIYIDAKAKTAEETFRDVLRVAQRRAQALYGRTDQWSRVQTAV